MRVVVLLAGLSIASGLGSSAAAESVDTEDLTIIASAATVRVSAGTSGRRTLRLPGLDFRFQFRFACPGAAIPQSLSMTIADTHRNLGADQLTAATNVAHAVVRIPAGQIAPVAVEGFCAADAPAADTLTLTLASLLSASASLRCGDDDNTSIRYGSVPLDVVLVCDPPDQG